MLDGHETVEIAWGELRLEGAIQHAGRTRNRGNSLRRASLEDAIQHAGRARNRANSLRKASPGDAIQHAGRTRNRANSLRRASLGRRKTTFKPWIIAWGELNAELLMRLFQSCSRGFFRTNVIIAIVLKNCGSKTGQTAPRPVKPCPKAEK